jgi:prevent-host-death family protein
VKYPPGYWRSYVGLSVTGFFILYWIAGSVTLGRQVEHIELALTFSILYRIVIFVYTIDTVHLLCYTAVISIGGYLMVKTMGAREARNNFSQLLGQVHFGGQVVVVERFGRPMVAIIPLEDYQQLIAEREARFQVLDEIRQRLPDLSVEEVEQDVAEAIAAVRAADAARGS